MDIYAGNICGDRICKKTAEKRERGGTMESAAVNPKIQQGAGETRKLAASFVGSACSLI